MWRQEPYGNRKRKYATMQANEWLKSTCGLVLFLRDQSRWGGDISAWHTNNNMLGLQKRLKITSGTFQVDPKDYEEMLSHAIDYYRTYRSAKASEAFALTEIVNLYYTSTLQLDQKINGQDTWENIPTSNVFFDFDELKKSVCRTDARRRRLLPLRRSPPVGTVVESLHPDYGRGTVGVCLGGYGKNVFPPDRKGVRRIIGEDEMRVLLYPAFHGSCTPRIIVTKTDRFRMCAYTVEEQSAFVHVIYSALKSIIKAYRKAFKALSAEDAEISSSKTIDFQNLTESLRCTLTQVVWCTRVASGQQKNYNFQIRMPNICAPYPVVKAFSARISMMLNTAYTDPAMAKSKHGLPKWCADALHHMVQPKPGSMNGGAASSSSSATKKTKKSRLKQVSYVDGEGGPLNPDLTNSIRLLGMAKRNDPAHYMPTAVFVEVRHAPTHSHAAHGVISKYIANIQKCILQEPILDVEAYNIHCRRPMSLGKHHTFPTPDHKIAWDILECHIGPGGHVLPGNTNTRSVVCADLLWCGMMRELCSPFSENAARKLSKLSIFPNERQRRIASHVVYPCNLVSPYITGREGRASSSCAPLHVDIKVRNAIRDIVDTFCPVDESPSLEGKKDGAFNFQWAKRPPPYKNVPIEKITRSDVGGQWLVTLRSLLCCRKMFATRGTDGYHRNNNARLVIYSNGIVRASCFSKNGPCCPRHKKAKMYDQVGRWNAEHRESLGFTDASPVLDPPIDCPVRPPVAVKKAKLERF